MNKKDQLKRYHIIEVLKTVYDPEISVNVYDLGLIYSIEIEDSKNVKIKMTLTSANCPFAQSIPVEVRDKVLLVRGIKEVSVEIVWDPQWGPDQMSEMAKIELNLL